MRRLARFRDSLDAVDVDDDFDHGANFPNDEPLGLESQIIDVSPNGDANVSFVEAVADPIPAATVRESTPNVAAAASGFTFLNANVRALRRKSAEVARLVERCGNPTFVVFTETWLDKASEEIRLPGYVEISRRDRGSSAHGGVIVFAKFGFEHAIVHVGTSEVAERTWHVIHSNRGPLLFGAWYRPPNHGEVASIESLDDEVAKFGRNTLGTLLVGDMNVHEERWLRFSDGTSVEGRVLRDVACSHGWEERVRKPTRGPYLLDLALTDLGTEVVTKVVRNVSDHDGVFGTLVFSVEQRAPTVRRVYDYAKVSWGDLQRYFRDVDWVATFSGLDADEMAQRFVDEIIVCLDRFVPTKDIFTNTSAHPWLNDKCRQAIDAKLDAIGTFREVEARDSCSQTLVHEHDKYINKMRRKLAELPNSSRGCFFCLQTNSNTTQAQPVQGRSLTRQRV